MSLHEFIPPGAGGQTSGSVVVCHRHSSTSLNALQSTYRARSFGSGRPGVLLVAIVRNSRPLPSVGWLPTSRQALKWVIKATGFSRLESRRPPSYPIFSSTRRAWGASSPAATYAATRSMPQHACASSRAQTSMRWPAAPRRTLFRVVRQRLCFELHELALQYHGQRLACGQGLHLGLHHKEGKVGELQSSPQSSPLRS